MKLHNPFTDPTISVPMFVCLLILLVLGSGLFIIGIILLAQVLGPVAILITLVMIAASGPIYYMVTGKDPFKK